jgi:DNA polymerase III subunit delta'
MFSSLIGNPQAKRALERMVNQQSCEGTLLFKGPEGVGKGLFALEIAKALLNDTHTKVDRGRHPDLHLFYPEGKSGIHSIAAIHQLIDEMALPPFEAPYKVFILHDAERMLPVSSNALLKTLEEPSVKTLLILLTSQPERLLPTIVSRCRILSFFPVSEEEIRAFVEEKHRKMPEDARQIAFLAQGSVAKAALLSRKGESPTRALLIDILSTPYEHCSLLKALTTLEESIQSKEEEDSSAHKEIETLFDQILFWYRDRHLLALQGPSDLLFYQDHLPALAKAQGLPLPSLEKLLPLLKECQLASQRSMRLRTCLEYFFLKTTN